MISTTICLLYLCFIAIRDIKNKEIEIWALLLGLIPLLISVFFNEISIPERIAGLLLGGALAVFGYAFKRHFGGGDCILLLILGAIIGADLLFQVVTASFLSAFVFAAAGVIVKRLNAKSELPFFPFVLLGYIGVVCLG